MPLMRSPTRRPPASRLSGCAARGLIYRRGAGPGMAARRPSRPSRPFALAFAAVAVALAFLHGCEGARFRVDEVTLGLLALAGVPVLAMYVQAFMGGGLELRFRDLSEAQQI